MKCKFLLGFAAGMMLIGFVGVANALTLSEVGAVDKIKAEKQLGNAGEGTESDWVSSILGNGYTLSFKENTVSTDWTSIDNMAGVFAYKTDDDPSYFLIKTGGNTGNSNDWFLFSNVGSLDWAVISLVDMGFDTTTDKNGKNKGTSIFNIGKVSHIDGFDKNQPVPEPATMLLMGIGLIGFAMGRRRMAKNN